MKHFLQTQTHNWPVNDQFYHPIANSIGLIFPRSPHFYSSGPNEGVRLERYRNALTEKSWEDAVQGRS